MQSWGRNRLVRHLDAGTNRLVEIDDCLGVLFDVTQIEGIAMCGQGLMRMDRGVMFVLRSVMLVDRIEVGVRGHPLHCQHDSAGEMEEECLEALPDHRSNFVSAWWGRMIPAHSLSLNARSSARS